MARIENQKVLKIADKTYKDSMPEFITEEVVEVRRAKLIYYKWVSRLMAVFAILSLIYLVCSSLVLLTLVPRILIDGQIFTLFSDSDSFVKREYVNAKEVLRNNNENSVMESREEVMVNFIKQYVELRNTYIKDEAEMKKRWMWGGLVSYLSNKKVYEEFAKVYPKLQKEMEASKASRSVEIISVKRTGGEKSDIWEVVFKTYDFSFSKVSEYSSEQTRPEITEKYWKVNIGCGTNPYRRIAYKRLLNPLGFYVGTYSQSEIEN